MAGWTNRGKFNDLNHVYRNTGAPTQFYIALVLATPTPTPDVNLFGDAEVDEIVTGNGYVAGGIALARNSTDFDVLTEDDSNDRSFIQLRNISWTASGGPIPASGNGARYAILTDDNGTQTSRNVYHFWDLAADRTVSVGQTLTLQDCEIRLTE